MLGLEVFGYNVIKTAPLEESLTTRDVKGNWKAFLLNVRKPVKPRKITLEYTA